MTSQPSSLTPLGFTREYQAYRAINTTIPFPDSRLLAAVRFWTRFPQALVADAYSSFWLEDLPPLLAIDAHAFDDFHPDELAEIASFMAGLDPAHFKTPLTVASLWEQAARKWLYVGEAAKALECLAKAGIPGPDLVQIVPQTHVDAQLCPAILMEQICDDDDPLRTWLVKFDADWRAIRESGHTNQATCVLVERDAGGKPIRGRLRTLEAHIEALPKGRDADEVVFGHQLCTADDPQVCGAYAAVASFRHETRGSSNPQSAIRNPQLHFRARFTFANGSHEPYGGDSLAFACYAAAYGDWWSKDLHRERRLVSSQVALTGVLTPDGQAERVAENSLTRKVERVFFSPLSFLVVPHTNREAAEAAVKGLQETCPNRRLRILTAERASDLVADGNITIPERVCLGEYAVRAAAKYTKSAKVQVPLLAVLCYLLLCLVYPKAWVGFDRNPSHVQFTHSGMIVQNERGQELWDYEFEYRHDSIESLSRLGNLDGDSESEVLCLLCTPEGELTPLVGQLFAFDHNGEFMFQRSAIILNEYPGDTSERQFYQSHLLDILETSSGTHILTGVSKWMPARVHFKVWDKEGALIAWYINAGSAGGREAQRTIVDSATNTLYVIGTNNRVNASCLFSLNLDSSFGASPPYSDPIVDLSAVKPGNQLLYYVFPNTDLAEARSTLYNRAKCLIQETPELYRFDVDEFGGNRHVQDSVAEVMYYFDSEWRLSEVRCSDAFIAARNDLVAQGRLPRIDWPDYERELFRRVRVWADTGWGSCPPN